MTTRVLPVTFTDPPAQRARLNWRDTAACRASDLAVFFPLGEDKQASSAQDETAKQICNACPVRLHCLTWAMTLPERHGIWGGASAAERRAWRATGGHDEPVSTELAS